MIKILTHIWPVIIPVVIYLQWYLRNYYRKDIKVKDELLIAKRNYTIFTIISIALIGLAMALFYLLSAESSNHLYNGRKDFSNPVEYNHGMMKHPSNE